ncbi:HupE/UreJ family protein [Mesorhizobium sp. B4-1-3]|uniref:HupE/UreJ family protein n=1 Tax=Mesorhizobium sp. B4-1-3 TaxID=2589889 RepID=UPI0032B30DB0
MTSISTMAHAHIVQSGSGGFGSGFEHPLTGLDHFLAMFAVGLWGAQIGGRSIWTLPVAFPLIMVMGGIAGIARIPLPGVEISIALSILALGLAIACAWRPPEWVALLMIAVFAICHVTRTARNCRTRPTRPTMPSASSSRQA